LRVAGWLARTFLGWSQPYSCPESAWSVGATPQRIAGEEGKRVTGGAKRKMTPNNVPTLTATRKAFKKFPKFPIGGLWLTERKLERWRVDTAEKLEELLETKSFDHHIGHIGLAEGKYRVIGVEWIEKLLETLK